MSRLLKNVQSLISESRHEYSDNLGKGYHGAVDVKVHGEPKKGENQKTADDIYREMHKTVRKITGADPEMVKHYLDSGHGRKLADAHNDQARKKLAPSHTHKYIKQDFEAFSQRYNKNMFESDELQERAEQQHRVMVTYIDGKDPRKAVRERKVQVRAVSRDHALEQAHKTMTADGHEVLQTKHHSIHEEEQMKPSDIIKRVVKEEFRTKSADKRPVAVRTASGKLIVKNVPRKQDIVHPGGREKDDSPY